MFVVKRFTRSLPYEILDIRRLEARKSAAELFVKAMSVLSAKEDTTT